MYIACDQSSKNFFIRKVCPDGKATTRKEPFYSTLFLASKKAKGEYKGFVTNKKLQKYEFESNEKHWEFKNKMKSAGIYGNLPPLHQLIRTMKVKPSDIALIKPWAVDIEVYAPECQPKPEIAHRAPISSICFGNIKTGKYHSWILDLFGRCTLKPKKDWEVLIFTDEESMLKDFSNFVRTHITDIHVVTGWYSDYFDFPYIIRRMNHLFSDGDMDKNCKEALNLSPFKRLSKRDERDDWGNEHVKYSIKGLPILDYLTLFKKYNFTPRPSMKLESVCQEELGHGKLDHSQYKSFPQFYEDDINTYNEYNLLDTKLIGELDDKFNYIALAISIAVTCKINFEDVISPIKCWEALIYNYLMDKKIVTNPSKEQRKFGKFEGAFVKKPEVKMHHDIISYDLASLYPSVIRALNISPETLVHTEFNHDISKEAVINGYVTDKKEYCASPSGTYFRKGEQGVVPQLMEMLYNERKETKKIMKQKIQELEALDGEE